MSSSSERLISILTYPLCSAVIISPGNLIRRLHTIRVGPNGDKATFNDQGNGYVPNGSSVSFKTFFHKVRIKDMRPRQVGDIEIPECAEVLLDDSNNPVILDKSSPSLRIGKSGVTITYLGYTAE